MKPLKSVFAGIMISVSGLLVAETANANFTSVTNSIQFNLAEITQQDVVDYLKATGHAVLCDPITNDGGKTWICKTSIGELLYKTTVYVQNDAIVGHDDEEI